MQLIDKQAFTRHKARENVHNPNGEKMSRQMIGGKMTGKPENNRLCPICGGLLTQGEATIPYVLKDNTVVIVKNVPAEICGDCREAFTAGRVTDQLVTMVRQLKELHSEVSVVSYREYEVV